MAKKKTIKNQLYCTIKKAIITKDGDFVPEGTPVSVLCWDKKNPKRILVKTLAHMYADDLGEDEDGIVPVIGENLMIAVKPSMLVYNTY